MTLVILIVTTFLFTSWLADHTSGGFEVYLQQSQEDFEGWNGRCPVRR